MKSFIPIDKGTKVDGITWPAFDRALKESMVSEVYLTRTFLLTHLSIPHPRPRPPLLKLLSALIPHPETLPQHSRSVELASTTNRQTRWHTLQTPQARLTPLESLEMPS